jgi:hypothetical protein
MVLLEFLGHITGQLSRVPEGAIGFEVLVLPARGLGVHGLTATFPRQLELKLVCQVETMLCSSQ